MFNHRLLIVKASALAVVALLIAAGPGAAQRYRGYYSGYPCYHGYPGYYGGYSRYSGYASGHYGPFRPPTFHTGSHYYGLGFQPRSVQFPRDPSAGAHIFVPAYSRSGSLSAGYPAPRQDSKVVYIEVRVPPDAEIWFGDVKTAPSGAVRWFVSPPLSPGRDYSYQIRARWIEGGREVTQTQHVNCHAGDRLSISFPES